MKAALGIAVLTFGGTALAARTGSLPSGMQDRAHTIFSDVGVPPPAPAASTQFTRGAVTASAAPSPAPAPSRSGAPGPSATTTLGLCREWVAARREPPGKAVPAQTRRALAAAAGGVPEIDGYCAALLGTASPTATPPGTGKPAGPGKPPEPGRPAEPGKPSGSGKLTPSHPGKGTGK